MLVALGLMACVVPALSSLQGAETPEQTFQTIYGEQLKAARATPKPDDDRALASQLINDAPRVKDNPALMGIMLRQAEALALEDPPSGDIAHQAAVSLIANAGQPAAAVWQELCDHAVDALSRRRATGEDLMAAPCCDWLVGLVATLHQAGDAKGTDLALATLLREAQAFKFKFLVEQTVQLQARVKLEAANAVAIKSALAKLSGPGQADDPKANLVAAETILCQAGDWAAAAPCSQKANEQKLNQVYAFRVQRKAKAESILDEMLDSFTVPSVPGAPAEAQPVPTPAAADAAPLSAPILIELADYLTTLTVGAHRPTLAGKACLLNEVQELLAVAAAGDGAGLTTVQKLSLVSRLRVAKTNANKAQSDLRASLEKGTQPWVQLQQGALKDDWESRSPIEHWKITDEGSVQVVGNDQWFAASLHSKRASPHDFVFEGQFRGVTAGAQPVFCFGPHMTHPFYFLYFENGKAILINQYGPAQNKRTISSASCPTELGRWYTLRAVFEGNRRRFWVDGQPLIDATDAVDVAGFSPGMNAVNGTGEFQNLRIRELK